MNPILSILQLLAGIGLFVFAMLIMEDSIRHLSGRQFKLFLQRVSNHGVGAASGGALVTAILQSSSLVSLMVLAFVGSGILPLRNALAVILGANFGTTLSSWVVAVLGFKINIESMAYPAIIVAGILVVFSTGRKNLKYIAFLLMGFAMLFMGLSWMKLAMEAQVRTFDFTPYRHLPLFAFVCLGFVITTLIQSSSATMALTLSALHSGMLEYDSAVALVIGSETGTTIKVMLGALGGDSTKKQVALGNFLFNIVMTILSFVFIEEIIHLIRHNWAIQDPLIALVMFSSLTNLAGIVLFLPVLKPYARMLERFFKKDFRTASSYICFANAKEPETALDLFKKETAFFIYNSMLFNLSSLDVTHRVLKNQNAFELINDKRKWNSMSSEERYEFLKHAQGELQVFYLELRKYLADEALVQLNLWISAVRSAMHAVKSIKDVEKNIFNLSHSSKDLKFDFFETSKNEVANLYETLEMYIHETKTQQLSEIYKTYQKIFNQFHEALEQFYSKAGESNISDIEVTTVLNFNRELFTSNKAMLMSVKDYVLPDKEARDFNEMLVYAS